MLLEKYKPKAISGMIANRLQASELKRAVSMWKRGSAVVLSGPPGCGKTLSVELIARELGFEFVTGTVEELLASSTQSSIWSRGKILIGDLDTEFSAGDATKLIEESRWPVIFVTIDVYQRSLIELRKDSRIEIIQFQKVGAAELAGFLGRICAAESIVANERALYELAMRSDGDARWALIALESLASVELGALQNVDKDRVEKIFDTLDAIFQRRYADEIEPSLIAWVVENLPDRYSGAELAHAYRCLADSDRFGRSGMDKYSQEVFKLLPVSRMRAQYRPPQRVNGGFTVPACVHCSAKKSKAYSQVLSSINKSGCKAECD